jgi:chemotaxis protein histidine kinase CheA
MSIWGHRDSEPPPGEAQPEGAQPEGAQPEGAHQTEPGADQTQEPAGPEHQAEEPAPAFWRAQGETPGSFGRAPADAPSLAYGHVPADAPLAEAPAPSYGQQAPGEPPAPPVGESPADTDAPVPVLTGKIVALDGETAVQEAGEPAAADAPEPAVPDAEQPAATEAEWPAATEAEQPAATEAEQPAGSGAEWPAATEAEQPAGAGAEWPAATEAAQPAGTEAQQPAVTPAAAAAASPAAAAPASAAGVSAQRWSEILVSFVDDPRASVKMAADAVDEAIDEFVNSVRDRQRTLASSWQSTETGTEQLRTALRDYRKLWHQVQQLDLGEKTGV